MPLLLYLASLRNVPPTAKHCSQHQCFPMSGAVFRDPRDTNGLSHEHVALALTPSAHRSGKRGCKGGHP